ncbi:NUDIX domain-containing protein [Haloferax mediterranei ATCC 33500]|uniref:DNA mismatch repair protein MutT n=1 Tax=Haloferax mediterranei (strain ATCC 33500 / DSM 1411 / JCM 8866 / NBRC 14739 / NCIMB 2177 / R-4) TaxID=523841 RepID=I3R529_HALMT|nr:NUDIX domain-containing protein [Haloferax mediterranei]AFK19339.1 NUDIX hydrolase [Haloferax mediterranei ATCC 33500]AHZ21306.1 DNA mismatch repair protein MutT [Haloferax mediterranei ATCC 33500]EMA04470.1 NUDIX hydrolase [Haloferax mediterranei ATCC 33500]MDX5989444.1 NUDIX domain-containing protein [Haloferax mediterranei ATCC 33500]QCQ75808.1 NUDIX domain-containing protein [Haloferax mediterranei ATCC 33500]
MPAPREAPAPHDLAAGVVVIRDDAILAVYEKDRWGLPKGGSEPGEFFFETAAREAEEETGVPVDIQSLAFTSEIRGPNRRIYLQRFYHATPQEAVEPSPSDPDDEIERAAYIPLSELGTTLTYRPRVEPLRDWLRDRKPRHYTYDLTSEPSHVEE